MVVFFAARILPTNLDDITQNSNNNNHNNNIRLKRIVSSYIHYTVCSLTTWQAIRPAMCLQSVHTNVAYKIVVIEMIQNTLWLLLFLYVLWVGLREFYARPCHACCLAFHIKHLYNRVNCLSLAVVRVGVRNGLRSEMAWVGRCLSNEQFVFSRSLSLTRIASRCVTVCHVRHVLCDISISWHNKSMPIPIPILIYIWNVAYFQFNSVPNGTLNSSIVRIAKQSRPSFSLSPSLPLYLVHLNFLFFVVCLFFLSWWVISLFCFLFMVISVVEIQQNWIEILFKREITKFRFQNYRQIHSCSSHEIYTKFIMIHNDDDDNHIHSCIHTYIIIYKLIENWCFNARSIKKYHYERSEKCQGFDERPPDNNTLWWFG